MQKAYYNQATTNLAFHSNETSKDKLSIIYCRIFWPWSSKGVAYANFISDLLSVVFASFRRIYELIRLFEMKSRMWVAIGQYRPL